MNNGTEEATGFDVKSGVGISRNAEGIFMFISSFVNGNVTLHSVPLSEREAHQLRQALEKLLAMEPVHA